MKAAIAMGVVAIVFTFVPLICWWSVAAALNGATDPTAWQSVPPNCAAEYDTRGRIVASYCAP